VARGGADTTHPAGRDRGQTSRSGNPTLLISHHQRTPVGRDRGRDPEAGREPLRRRGWLNNRPGSVARSRPAVHAVPSTEPLLALAGSLPASPCGPPLSTSPCRRVNISYFSILNSSNRGRGDSPTTTADFHGPVRMTAESWARTSWRNCHATAHPVRFGHIILRSQLNGTSALRTGFR
jgi:hypothetical protein